MTAVLLSVLDFINQLKPKEIASKRFGSRVVQSQTKLNPLQSQSMAST
jgi:hypothetical protein